MNKLSHFEENLLTELREVVANQATPEAPRRRGRLVLAAAGAGLVAAGLVLGLPAIDSDRTPAAYAITSNDDGSLTITVNRLEDPDGLERDLAAHGITADVTFAPPGTMCDPMVERFQPQGDAVQEVFIGVDRGDAPLTVLPTDLEGKTLVLEGRATEYDSQEYVFLQYAVSGPVAPCQLVDLPVS